MKRALLALVVLVACSLGAEALAGSDPGVKCASGKLKEIGKYFACRLKADAKATTTGFLPVYTDCEDKFSEKFTGIETKAGAGVCPTENNLSAVEQCVAQAALDCAALAKTPATGACDTGTCNDCVQCTQEPGAACEDEAQACTNEPDCIALNDCLGACSDSPCFDACINAHPTGVPLLQAFSDCVIAECPITCAP